MLLLLLLLLHDMMMIFASPFQVTNEGPWHVEGLNVLIDWPFQLSVPGREESDPGKWLLYLSETPEVSPFEHGSCYVNTRMVNQLGLRDQRGRGRWEDTLLSRMRRDVVDDDEEDRSSSSSHHVLLRCGDGVTKCHVIECTLKHLRANESAIIRVRSRVWNSTLVEEFSAVPVAIETTARIVLDPEVEVNQRIDNDVTRVNLYGYPNVSSSASLSNVPIWIILIAICTGLLLVSCIVFVLYKFGFFRRQRFGGTKDNSNDDGPSSGADESDLMISGKKSSYQS